MGSTGNLFPILPKLTPQSRKKKPLSRLLMNIDFPLWQQKFSVLITHKLYNICFGRGQFLLKKLLLSKSGWKNKSTSAIANIIHLLAVIGKSKKILISIHKIEKMFHPPENLCLTILTCLKMRKKNLPIREIVKTKRTAWGRLHQ